MCSNFMWNIALCGVLFVSIVSGQSCKDEPKCMITRTYGLKVADCYNKDFKTIPKCVTTDVQVLEMSYNRLRKITRSEIGKFSYLQMLYLADNLLLSIDEDTFLDLEYLNVLDLSMNAISTMPIHIFQLPALERLYLRQNQNANLDDALDKVRPITSRLTYLDISFTTDVDNTPEFPNLGMLPYLLTLNVTGNKYSLIKPIHFAGLCKMQILLSQNITGNFEDSCDCWKINRWLERRNVLFTPFTCPVMRNYCQNISLSVEEKEMYEKCVDAIEKFESDKSQKIFLGVGITVVILFAIAVLYAVVSRKACCKKNEDDNILNVVVRASLLNDTNHKP